MKNLGGRLLLALLWLLHFLPLPLLAALGQGLDVDRASKCKLLADAQGESPEVDVHIITVDPTSLLDDERMLLMVNRTPEADAEAQTAASKPGEPPLP